MTGEVRIMECVLKWSGPSSLSYLQNANSIICAGKLHTKSMERCELAQSDVNDTNWAAPLLRKHALFASNASLCKLKIFNSSETFA